MCWSLGDQWGNQCIKRLLATWSTLIDQLFSEDPQGDYYYYAEYGEEYGDNYKDYGNYEETYNYEDASEGIYKFFKSHFVVDIHYVIALETT